MAARKISERLSAANSPTSLFDADPTRDIKNARKIFKIMKDGAFVDIPADALR